MNTQRSRSFRSNDHLGPRLRLGLNCRRGSASPRMNADGQAGACRAVASQAETGTQGASLLRWEAFAALLAVAFQGVLNDRQCRGGGLKLLDLDRLAFERLVILKEALQERQAVRRQLVGFAKTVVLRVADGHRQNLVVQLAAV